ncbi:MAG: hypothetical protein KH282_08625 [Clostridiales bacterium]|nr:hypothetical protein [Clostridiales bacterium]
MFDYLKSDIRKEINYVTVENVQDETAGKLKAIAQKAKNEKNFEKSIACEEMIWKISVWTTQTHSAKKQRYCPNITTAATTTRPKRAIWL